MLEAFARIDAAISFQNVVAGLDTGKPIAAFVFKHLADGFTSPGWILLSACNYQGFCFGRRLVGNVLWSRASVDETLGELFVNRSSGYPFVTCFSSNPVFTAYG